LTQRPHHIFFDLDHTLWDYDTNAEETIRQLLIDYRPHFGSDLAFDEFFPVYLGHNHRLWAAYRNREIDNLTLRNQRWRDSFRDLGILHGEWIQQFGDDFLELCPRKPHLLPNAIAVLDMLSPHYPLHIITNGFAAIQDVKLECSGLRPYFEVIVTPDKSGCTKPHPEIFELALASVGCLPGNALLVGDSYPEDMIGGNAAGMHVVFFNPKGKDNPDGFPEIRDLMELTVMLELGA
jgi:YjjG family noncanonical pyrimidine nucleotidase